jgi:hypothetical protein
VEEEGPQLVVVEEVLVVVVGNSVIVVKDLVILPETVHQKVNASNVRYFEANLS